MLDLTVVHELSFGLSIALHFILEDTMGDGVRQVSPSIWVVISLVYQSRFPPFYVEFERFLCLRFGYFASMFVNGRSLDKSDMSLFVD